MSIVQVDYYEDKDSVHVFVSGHALHPAESTIHAAVDIAKAVGQRDIPLTTYKANGRPERRLIPII